jgi:hypothetical protein
MIPKGDEYQDELTDWLTDSCKVTQNHIHA